MMTSGTNRFVGMLSTVWYWELPRSRVTKRTELCAHDWPYTSQALCRVMHPPPYTSHLPSHCLDLMPKEELKAWEPTFYWRSQNKHVS